MKDKMTVQEFEAKVRKEIHWDGYGSDIGIEEWSFEKGFRDFQKLASRLGEEYLKALYKVHSEKLGLAKKDETEKSEKFADFKPTQSLVKAICKIKIDLNK